MRCPPTLYGTINEVPHSDQMAGLEKAAGMSGAAGGAGRRTNLPELILVGVRRKRRWWWWWVGGARCLF